MDEQADDEAILIFGASVSEDMNDEISITVIATGFDGSADGSAENFKMPEGAKSPKTVINEEGIAGTEVT